MSVGLLRALSDRWDLMAELYYQDLDDLVVLSDATSRAAGNTGDGSSYGLDTALNRRFDNGWSANFTYSFNRSRRDDNDGRGEYDADFHRRHSLTAGAIWEINERWKLSARWKWASGRPTDDFIINDDVLGPGQPLRFSKENINNNANQFKDFHTLNFRVDYRRPLGPLDVIAFLDVINVYGRSNEDELEFDERRGVNVANGVETFPQIGLRFEY